jgi:NADH-quinone oxidoreductase subunit J
VTPVTETVGTVGFAVLAAFAIVGSLGVVSSKNVVHAAYWLLATSVTAAGLYFLLAANFVALLQLLVYAAAVAVLNIFTIMLTLRRREDAVRPLDFSWAALAIAVAFGSVVTVAVIGARLPVGELPARIPDVADLGAALFSRWLLPFELASVVLLIAIVGAVWWSKEDED